MLSILTQFVLKKITYLKMLLYTGQSTTLTTFLAKHFAKHDFTPGKFETTTKTAPSIMLIGTEI